MAMPFNTKFVLKNTTKMSLHERFTMYNEEVEKIRKTAAVQRQSNSANLRLVQQMASRPTVLAALGVRKRALQYRLGKRQQDLANVKARLGNNTSNIRGRLGPFQGRTRNRNGLRPPGISPLYLKERLGAQKFKNFTALRPNQRLRFRRQQQQPQQQHQYQQGGFRNRGNQQKQRNLQQQGKVMRGGKRNAGRGGGGGRGGRMQKFNPGKKPSKQDLDNELDSYMAETKGHLDAQLGEYMSHV